VHYSYESEIAIKGKTIGFGNFAREEGIIMDYHETVEIYKHKLKGIIL
jgi:histidine triad (HIT) family protein